MPSGARPEVPAVVLLLEAKGRRAHDDADLEACLPALEVPERSWTADAIALVHGQDHPRVPRLRADDTGA